MIIDTSALIAALLDERDADGIRRALARGDSHISAATLVEARIVARAKAGPEGERRLERLLRVAEVSVVPFDAEQAQAACDAYRDYGRGSGHRAKLNLGDTFSYALASVSDEPLLYVGDDFAYTDIPSAL
ncbi:type II toxin-antitoxin system VapC family toxin [Microbacterium sp. MPKO10]|uniref:type II toxin-antitoxin system VapC family toxin n=1 Tax=Microbacterium sp. MPKO10 TaxID=2989818 RepID=UPI002235EE15|nr:type II toxin-antitoxin system VapC family toxin [Microbacterium sp. MPKO10]MCW4457244.1 type II toxin-antitoxin system VapC family toxin [Microbacterium sp. MPKO10]